MKRILCTSSQSSRDLDDLCELLFAHLTWMSKLQMGGESLEKKDRSAPTQKKEQLFMVDRFRVPCRSRRLGIRHSKMTLSKTCIRKAPRKKEREGEERKQQPERDLHLHAGGSRQTLTLYKEKRRPSSTTSSRSEDDWLMDSFAEFSDAQQFHTQWHPVRLFP